MSKSRPRGRRVVVKVFNAEGEPILTLREKQAEAMIANGGAEPLDPKDLSKGIIIGRVQRRTSAQGRAIEEAALKGERIFFQGGLTQHDKVAPPAKKKK